MKRLNIFFLLLFALIVNHAKAQLIVTSADSIQQCTPEWLVRNVLLESGVTVSNVLYNGSSDIIDCNSIGYFETGHSSTNLGIEAGLILATGGVSVAVGPNNNDGKVVLTTCDEYFDESLAALTLDPDSVYDMSVLEFDFVPWDKEVSFNYVFASEEYLEWVGTFYNDVFGFFVSGPNPDGGFYENQNMALIPGTDETVSINSVYTQHNSQYYVDNTGGETVQFDGFTTVQTVSFKVWPMETYHIKMGICDVGDIEWDSGVFLEAHSFMSNFTYDMTIDNIPYQEILENQYFCTNRSIEFNTVTEWNYDDVVWYFGDGTSAQGANVWHTYAEDGIYEVVNVLHNPHRVLDSLFLTTTIEIRSFTSSEEASTCQNEPFLWHGQLLDQTGVYFDTLASVIGCDSVVSLNLTAYEDYTTEINETHCEKFDWNGQTYIETGIYEYHGQSIHGCDSLAILNLTIKHGYASALHGPEWVVAEGTYRYAVPDSLTIAPNSLTWTCNNPEWRLTPSDDGYYCDLWPSSLGQGILTARTGVECDSVYSIAVNATGYDVEEHEAQNINIFPNPAHSQITVESQQISQIQLINSLGQTVLKQNYDTIDFAPLDISLLPKGIYVVKVTTMMGEKNCLLVVER
jgi:PKD repeat protein